MSDTDSFEDVVPTLGALALVNIEVGEVTLNDGKIIPLGRVDLYYEHEDGTQDAVRFLLDEEDATNFNGMLEQLLGVLRAFSTPKEEK